MSTRGVYGFYKNGINKLTYNSSDSYPSGLGEEIINFVKENTIHKMSEIFDKIILVDRRYKPTLQQIEECRKSIDVDKDNKRLNDWGILLEDAQGDLNAYNTNLRYMIDSNDFIKYSLFCEWGYIINLDTNKLEIYKGRQKENQDNRYKLSLEEINKDKDEELRYYNCKLVEEFDLNNIPNNWQEILEKYEDKEDED